MRLFAKLAASSLVWRCALRWCGCSYSRLTEYWCYCQPRDVSRRFSRRSRHQSFAAPGSIKFPSANTTPVTPTPIPPANSTPPGVSQSMNCLNAYEVPFPPPLCPSTEQIDLMRDPPPSSSLATPQRPPSLRPIPSNSPQAAFPRRFRASTPSKSMVRFSEDKGSLYF